MRHRLRPIESSTINKSQASFQFHMLDMMSEMIKQQKQTNMILKSMMNLPTDVQRNKSALSFHKTLGDLSFSNKQGTENIPKQNDSRVIQIPKQKQNVIVSAQNPAIRTEDITRQIISELKLMNKNLVSKEEQKLLLPPMDQVRLKTYETEDIQIKVSNQRYYSRLEQIQPHADRRQAKIKIDFHKLIQQYGQTQLTKPNLEKAIKEWLGIVYRVTASISWNMLQNQLLNFSQTKILFTQNIIFNYIQLMKEIRKVNSQELSLKQRECIATSIVNKQAVEVLKFLCTQYPQTKIQAPNMAIRSTIVCFDERDDIKYDILGNSKVLLKYNYRKQYTGQVMRFINYLVDVVQQNYDYFENFFWKLFDSLYLPIQYRKQSRHHNQAQINPQYKAKVKRYTKFAIGRKISKNVSKYTQQEIENGVFFLKSTNIIRVLFKWVQELIAVIKNPKAMIQQRFYPFKTHDGKQIMLDYSVRNGIYLAIEKKKKSLFAKLALIQSNCFKIEGNLTDEKYIFKQDLSHLSEEQINVGLFSSNLKDALSSFLYMQLNQLINFLLEIPLQVDVNSIGIQGYHFKKKASQDLKRVNLVSFNIFDLLRCKCTSGEDQIIYLINMLKTLHQQKNNFELVRIKDRLNQGTRDILINAHFNNGPVFEIQLSVTSQVDLKQQMLDQYNHFLYELRRSKLLGPLIENVSIWTSLQQRALYFNDLVWHQFQNAKNKPFKHNCSKNNNSTFIGPMVCNRCKTFYNIPRTCLQNKICHDCEQIVCGQCWHMGLEDSERKKFIFGDVFDHTLFDHISEYQDLKNIDQFPIYSLIVKKAFLRAQLSFLQKFPAIGNQPCQIAQVVYRKMANKIILRGFLSQQNASKRDQIQNFIVYGIDPKYIETRSVQQISLILEEQPQIKIISLLEEPNYVRDIKVCNNVNNKAKFEVINRILQIINNVQQRGISNKITIFRNKQAKLIILAQFSISREDIARKLTKRSNIQALKKLCNQNCKIISLQHKNVTQELNREKMLENVGEKHYKILCQNLKKLFLNFGSITNVEDFKYMTNIQILSINNNQISSLSGLQDLSNLRQLYVDNNRVKSLKPLTNLVKLRTILANCNQIQSLQGTQNLSQLETLEIYRNKIQNLKDCTLKWNSIKLLYLRQNDINSFEELPGMQKLNQLSLSNNPLQKINSLSFLNSLTILSLTNLRLQNLPLNQLKGLDLIQLSCHENKIKSIKGISAFRSLKYLGLNNNQIQEIEDIETLKLQKLHLSNNKIKVVKGLKNSFDILEQLTLQGNPLEDCKELFLSQRKFKITYSTKIVNDQVELDMQQLSGNYNKILSKIFG